MLTVLELALWLSVYGFFCGAASAILGKENVQPMAWLVLLPYEVGRILVISKGWQNTGKSDTDKKDGPTTLMENDG